MVGVVGSIPIVPTINMKHLKVFLKNLSFADLKGEIKDVEGMFYQVLPVQFRGKCRFGSFQDQVLTLFLENTAWANRLKYLLPDLTKALKVNSYFNRLESIQLKIKRDFTSLSFLPTDGKKSVKVRQITEADLLVWNHLRKKLKKLNQRDKKVSF